jgi:phage gpG-like protein
VARMTLQQAIAYCRRMKTGGDLQRPLKICGQIMLSGVKKGFTDQATPDGKAWPKLKWNRINPTWAKTRGASGQKTRGTLAAAKALLDTGQLRASCTTTNAPGSLYKLGRNFVQVGTNKVQARLQNYGGKVKIAESFRRFLHAVGIHIQKATQFFYVPARRFIGHRPENIVRYKMVFIEHQMRIARERARS